MDALTVNAQTQKSTDCLHGYKVHYIWEILCSSRHHGITYYYHFPFNIVCRQDPP